MNNLIPPVKVRKLPSSPEELSQIPRGHHDPDWAPRTLLRYIFPREHGLHNVFTSPPSDEGWSPNGSKDRYGNWKIEPGKAAYRNYEDRKDEIEVRNRAYRVKASTISLKSFFCASEGCDCYQGCENTSSDERKDAGDDEADHCPAQKV